MMLCRERGDEWERGGGGGEEGKGRWHSGQRSLIKLVRRGGYE